MNAIIVLLRMVSPADTVEKHGNCYIAFCLLLPGKSSFSRLPLDSHHTDGASPNDRSCDSLSSVARPPHLGPSLVGRGRWQVARGRHTSCFLCYFLTNSPTPSHLNDATFPST